MKTFIVIYIFLLFGVFISVADAATYYCGTVGGNDCDSTEMTSLISGASDGDSIIIRAGTHTWTSEVTVNKRITISGEGTCNGCGTATPSGTWPAQITLSGTNRGIFVKVTSAGSGFVNIGGIYFSGNLGTGTYMWTDTYRTGFVMESTANIADLRVHDCKFENTSTSGYMTITTLTRSRFTTVLFDHNYWNSTGTAGKDIYMVRTDTEESNSSPNSYVGIRSAGTPFDWGEGSGWVFAEDNTFYRPAGTSPDTSQYGMAFDSQSGGKIVFRHNYCTNNWIENHIPSTGGWSWASVAAEVYDNTFIWTYAPERYQTAFYLRSGTALIYNNHFEGFQTAIKFTGSGRGPSPGQWGSKDGTKDWDGNCQAGSTNPRATEPSDCGQPGVPYPTAYPVANSLGRGKIYSGNWVNGNPPSVQPQELKPVRMWNNTYSNLSGNCAGTTRYGQLLCISDDVGNSIENYNYYYCADTSCSWVATFLASYTPYTYPHPLQSGEQIYTAKPSPPILHVLQAY